MADEATRSQFTVKGSQMSNRLPTEDEVNSSSKHMLEDEYPTARRIRLPDPETMQDPEVQPTCELFGLAITLIDHSFKYSHRPDQDWRRTYADFYYRLSDGELCWTRTSANTLCDALVTFSKPYEIENARVGVFAKKNSPGWFLKFVQA